MKKQIGFACGEQGFSAPALKCNARGKEIQTQRGKDWNAAKLRREPSWKEAGQSLSILANGSIADAQF